MYYMLTLCTCFRISETGADRWMICNLIAGKKKVYLWFYTRISENDCSQVKWHYNLAAGRKAYLWFHIIKLKQWFYYIYEIIIIKEWMSYIIKSVFSHFFSYKFSASVVELNYVSLCSLQFHCIISLLPNQFYLDFTIHSFKDSSRWQ